MQKIKKFFRWLLLIIALVLIGFFSFYYWGTYSEGYRSGIVMKVTKVGVMFKTTEGQLNMQVIGHSDLGTASQVWDFSVENDLTAVIEDLRKASVSGARVELYYVQRYKTFPWRGASKYFVRGVKFQ